MSNFKSTKTERSGSLFGEVIFSYTRAQAIADRVLIDVTPTALEAGFRFPVATTAALMAAVETIPQQYSHEDIEGRLGDLLWMASLAAWRAKSGCSRIAFEVILHLEGTRRQYQTLILDIGHKGHPRPGDHKGSQRIFDYSASSVNIISVSLK
jgi:hypothetical protein